MVAEKIPAGPALMNMAGVGNAERNWLMGVAMPAADQETQFFLNLLQSEIGYLFLDRTRITPSGFAIGEHIYGLGLFAGEEITIEQKSYSKKQLTYEEQNEEEKQFDLELSSSLSTEI